MKLRYSDLAWEIVQALPPEQEAQVRRLIQAILLAKAPVGRKWAKDLRGRQLWIASALDTHLIYRITWYQVEGTLYIAHILIFPTPPDPNNP